MKWSCYFYCIFAEIEAFFTGVLPRSRGWNHFANKNHWSSKMQFCKLFSSLCSNPTPVHVSSFCELCSELYVGLSCRKKRKFLQSFLNFSSSDARIVPVFPMKAKSFDLCMKFVSKGHRSGSTR